MVLGFPCLIHRVGYGIWVTSLNSYVAGYGFLLIYFYFFYMCLDNPSKLYLSGTEMRPM